MIKETWEEIMKENDAINEKWEKIIKRIKDGQGSFREKVKKGKERVEQIKKENTNERASTSNLPTC